MRPVLTACLLSAVLLDYSATAASAQAPPAEPVKATDAQVDEKLQETEPLTLAEGELKVDAPKAWKKVKPRNRIIEAEFTVPADADPAGRLTIMASGGSIDANLARWVGQFSKSGDESAEPKIEKEEVNGMKLTIFDATGTYLDSPRGPFGPKVEKAGYRMIAGILQTGGVGNYFFKLVGPEEIVEENAEAFRAMVSSAEKSR
ncbi:MAG: hypothetical protein AAF589_04370 [Planctomycetota bacterium]